MEIAGRNLQQKNAIDDNLWIWPSSLGSMSSQSKESIFKPEFNVWFQAADIGIINKRSESEYIHFTDKSVSCKRKGGYQGATFLNFPPDKYTMSFFSDIACNIKIMAYVWQDVERVRYGSSTLLSHSFEAGRNQFEFEIKSSILPFMNIWGVPEGQFVTLTDIVIKEGAL